MITRSVYQTPQKIDSIKTRHLIQLIVFLFTISIGLQFYFYVQQALGQESITIPRPEGVEGFLPIGALMGWKRYFLSGEWDSIHPAAMVFFGFAVIISLFFHKAFCSWFCPVGTLSEWLWKAGKKMLGRNFRLPFWLDYILRSLKYLLLAFFLWVILTMSTHAISLFIDSSYYKLSDVKMLRFFTHMTITTGIVLALLVMGSFFIQNFWCRYFCPYGAFIGLFGFVSPTRINRNSTTCIDCGKCSQACPHALEVNTKINVASLECTACMDCIDVCPIDNTLMLKSFNNSKRMIWSSKSLGATIVIAFWGITYLATISGLWKSQLPEVEFRSLLHIIDSPLVTHPSIN